MVFGRGSDCSKFPELAEEDPEELEYKLDELRQCLISGDASNRTDSAAAVAKLAEINPSAARPLSKEAVRLLDDLNKGCRRNGTAVVVHLSAEYPEDFHGEVETLARLAVEDHYGPVRENAAQALANIATADAIGALEIAAEEETEPEIQETIEDCLEQVEGPVDAGEGDDGDDAVVKYCTECGADFTSIPGIPQRCPGCGVEIAEIL